MLDMSPARNKSWGTSVLILRVYVIYNIHNHTLLLYGLSQFYCQKPSKYDSVSISFNF